MNKHIMEDPPIKLVSYKQALCRCSTVLENIGRHNVGFLNLMFIFIMLSLFAVQVGELLE